MMLSAVVFLLTVGLLVAEWRLRSSVLRLVMILIAICGIGLLLPSPHIAARRAMNLPPTERIERWSDAPMTEYQSGVATMRREVYANIELHSTTRLILMAAVLWLAFSPALRDLRTSSTPETDKA
jgi:hypothetical protein